MSIDKSFNIREVEELAAVAEYLIEAMSKTNNIVFLYGDLGAGKTTFVKQIVKMLGSQDDTSSPTYSLVNEYHIPKGKLYHIDLYRINDTDEAVDMGIEEYLFSESYCFIEWPQVIVPLVDDYIKVEISVDAKESRTININLVSDATT